MKVYLAILICFFASAGLAKVCQYDVSISMYTCSGLNEQCNTTSNLCECNTGRHYENEYCVANADYCEWSSQCWKYSNTECNHNKKKCECKTNYHKVNNVCEKAYGQCYGDADCPMHATCNILAKCVCDDGWHKNGGKCDRNAYNYCKSTIDCSLNGYCKLSTHVCKCNQGYSGTGVHCTDSSDSVSTLAITLSVVLPAIFVITFIVILVVRRRRFGLLNRGAVLAAPQTQFQTVLPVNQVAPTYPTVQMRPPNPQGNQNPPPYSYLNQHPTYPQPQQQTTSFAQQQQQAQYPTITNQNLESSPNPENYEPQAPPMY